MKRLHWMILRMWPGPFVGWLGTLMFLLLMQFLIHYLPDLAGKGLSLAVIAELIVYSLAYMLVLAVPMSVLLATLMTYGRLAETKAYAVVKSAGVSLMQLIWPTLILGLVVAGGMAYFNNVVLPEANFRAKNLWRDIRTKKPGFELQPGVFYDGLSGYSILVQDVPPESDELRGVTIYDRSDGDRRSAVIKAQRGRIASLNGGRRIEMTLEDGEVHRLLPSNRSSEGDRYERLAFEQHRIRLDLSDFVFERGGLREGFRSDRTMPTPAMVAYVDSLQALIATEQQRLRAVTAPLGLRPDTLRPDTTRRSPPAGTDRPAPALPEAAPPTATVNAPAGAPGSRAAASSAADTVAAASSTRVATARLDSLTRNRVYVAALRQARTTRSEVEDAQRTLTWKMKRANQYLVEIYKKNSIALACLAFVLIGAPLGLSIRRGGLGTVGGLALGIFLFYWVTLVQGEKLADRGLLEPWIGMWIANAIMLALGLWLVVYVTLDLRATPPLRRRLWDWLRGSS